MMFLIRPPFLGLFTCYTFHVFTFNINTGILVLIVAYSSLPYASHKGFMNMTCKVLNIQSHIYIWFQNSIIGGSGVYSPGL